MKFKDKLKDVSNIIFDFNSVIIDSIHIIAEGFREIFSNYNEKLIEKLIK
ncbi:hypothetical protein [Candidatus Clostridium helianthi]|uniref:Uncharacterized protein n=1 Tax=Candidatus Clostridium helianthi TaxID=3381660 RepID=A0ABW8RZ12_9CLOT